MDIKEMRYPVQRTDYPRRCGRQKGRKEEKEGGRDRARRVSASGRGGEIRSSGIMEFLSPLEAQH